MTAQEDTVATLLRVRDIGPPGSSNATSTEAGTEGPALWCGRFFLDPLLLGFTVPAVLDADDNGREPLLPLLLTGPHSRPRLSATVRE